MPLSALPRRARSAHLAFLVTLGIALCLAGCSWPGPRSSPHQVYDLGPTPVATVNGSTPHRTLAFNGVASASALDSNAITYRLDYLASNEPRAYAESLWSMPPAELLDQRLSAHFAGHFWLVQGEQGRRDATLVLQLDEFDQVFESAQQSHASLKLRATLNRPDGSILSQATFHEEHPADTANAQGGVRALAQASDALAARLIAWIDQNLADRPR